MAIERMRWYKILLGTILVVLFGYGCKDDSAQTWQVHSHPKDMTLQLPNNQSIILKYIPAGSFLMGSPESEEGRECGEEQRAVTIDTDFWLGECEVTQEQFESVMGYNPSKDKAARKPVSFLRWEEALEFCKKVEELNSTIIPEGYELNFPFEAQWEYACRAGSTGAYGTGGEPKGKKDMVVYPVASFKPNDWGLYDMNGNVGEICYDYFFKYTYKKEQNAEGTEEHIPVRSNAENQFQPFQRIRRGGRSAERSGWSMNDSRHPMTGFRMCLRKTDAMTLPGL